MADSNPNLSPSVTHQPSLLGGAENIKLLFDEELDNRREGLARQRAWEAISLDLAQTASRRAQAPSSGKRGGALRRGRLTRRSSSTSSPMARRAWATAM